MALTSLADYLGRRATAPPGIPLRDFFGQARRPRLRTVAAVAGQPPGPSVSEVFGAGGGDGGGTGPTGPTATSPTFGSGPQGLGPLSGFNLGNVGPLSFGVSPLGSVGFGVNANMSDDPNVNALTNAPLNMALRQTLGRVGIPMGINPLAFIPSVAPVLGPMGLALSGFKGMVTVANLIARAAGIPTVHQNLQGLESNLRSSSESVRGVAQATVDTAQTIQQALSTGNMTGVQAAINAAIAQGVNPDTLAAALTSMGVQGISAQGSIAVPAAPSPFGISSVSGLAGASASGVPGVPGVTFTAQEGLVGPQAISLRGTVGQPDPTDTTSPSPTATASDVSAGEGPGPSAGPGAAPSGTAGPAASATASDVSEGGPGTGGVGAPAGVGEGGAVGGVTGGDEGVGDGGGGGGGGGGGCYLATWALKGLAPKDAEESRRAFQSFYRQWSKANPQHGQRAFVLYQRLAKQIIAKARQGGAERATQAYIHREFVQPTGTYISKKELPQAVQNLVRVVRTLAQRFGIPLPPLAEIPRTSPYAAKYGGASYQVGGQNEVEAEPRALAGRRIPLADYLRARRP